MGKKATFVIDEPLLAEARQSVEAGLFKSLNAFVETAIKDELDRVKKEKIRKAILEAGQDPLFLQDIEEIEKDFRSVDSEVVDSEL